MILDHAVSEYSSNISSVSSYCDELYAKLFSTNFERVHLLYSSLNSKVSPISDEDLMYILIELPLRLFAVSEELNRLRLNSEVIRLENKQKSSEYRSRISAVSDPSELQMTKSEFADYVSRSISSYMMEYELLLLVYNSLISRVENEISFSKELIMGAKKVWDSRRSAEQSNPVSPNCDSDTLPPYNMNR